MVEIEQFLETVLSLNPRLKYIEYINVEFVEKLIENYSLLIICDIIDYDCLVDDISIQLLIPSSSIEPFVEILVTYQIQTTSKQFFRICGNCGQSHNFIEINICNDRNSSVVKIKNGFVVVDDIELNICN